jgi:hypothetical protein
MSIRTLIAACIAIAASVPAVRPASAQSDQAGSSNWFGGPIYDAAPALTVTAALVNAGGGAKHFTFDKALVSMLGQKTVNAEVAKLEAQYGKTSVHDFISGMTFVVHDGLRRAAAAHVQLPSAPTELTGASLAKALVDAGTTSDGTWWSGYLFDKALSHTIHVQVMGDIDVKYGHPADQLTHRILNQAMYDVAQALGSTSVKLAELH